MRGQRSVVGGREEGTSVGWAARLHTISENREERSGDSSFGWVSRDDGWAVELEGDLQVETDKQEEWKE